MKKVLAVVLAVLMVLCTVPMAFASSDYNRVKVAADDAETIDNLSTEQIAGVLLDWVDRQIADISEDFSAFNTYAELTGMSIPTNLDGIIAYKDQIANLRGDFENLDTSALTTRTAAGSDLQFIYNVISFMAANKTTFAKVFAWEDGTTFDYGVVGEYIEDEDNNVDEAIVNFYKDYLIGNDIQDKFITEIAREMGYTNTEDGKFNAEAETFDEVLDNGIKGVVIEFLQDADLLSDKAAAAIRDDDQFDLKTTDVYTLVKHLFTLVQGDNWTKVTTLFTYACDNIIRPVLKTAFGYTLTKSTDAASDAVLAEFNKVYTEKDELAKYAGTNDVLFQAADGRYYAVKADGTSGVAVSYGESFLNFEAPSVEIWDASQKVGGAYTPTSLEVADYEPTVYTDYASYMAQNADTAAALAAIEGFGVEVVDTSVEGNEIPVAIKEIIENGKNGTENFTAVDMTDKFVMKINGKILGTDLSDSPIEISFKAIEDAVNAELAAKIPDIQEAANNAIAGACASANSVISGILSSPMGAVALSVAGLPSSVDGSVTINSATVSLSYKGYSDADTFVCEVTAVPHIDVTYNGNVWDLAENEAVGEYINGMSVEVEGVGTFSLTEGSIETQVQNIINQLVTNPAATIVVDHLNGTIKGIDDLTALMNFVDTDFDVDTSILDLASDYDEYKGFVGQANKVLCEVAAMLLSDDGYASLDLTEGDNTNLTENMQKICDKANTLLTAAKSFMNKNEFSEFADTIDLDSAFASDHGFNAGMLYDLDFRDVENVYVCAIRMGCDLLVEDKEGILYDIHMIVEDLKSLEQIAVGLFNYAMPKLVSKVNDLISEYGVSVFFTATTEASAITSDAAAKEYIMTKLVDMVYDLATQAVPVVNKIINDAIAKAAEYLGITDVPTVAFELNVEKGATYEATLTNLFTRFEELTEGFFRDGVITGADVYAKISSVLNNFLPLSSMLSNAGVNGANGAIDVSYIMTVLFDQCLDGEFEGFLRMFEVKEDELAGSDPVTYVLIKTSKHMVDPVFPGTVVPENTPASDTCQETFTGNANDQVIAANNMTSIDTYKTDLVDFALKLVREAGILPWFAKVEPCADGEDVWDEGTITTAVGCETDGEKTYTCTICGKTKTEVIPAKGHTEVDAAEVPATCTTDGTTAGTKCSVCGEILSGCEKIPAGHKSVNVAEVPATCTTDGTTAGTKCSVCGEILSGCEKIPAGHKYGDWVETTPAGCETAGVKTATCTVCGAPTTQTIPATGHNYQNGVCANCGAEEPTKTEETFWDKIVNFFQSIINWLKNLFS